MKQVFTASDGGFEYRTFNGWAADYSYTVEVSGDFSQSQILQLRAIVKRFETDARRVIELNAPAKDGVGSDLQPSDPDTNTRQAKAQAKP